VDIGLGDAVAALRDEVVDAVARRSEDEVEFAVGPIELEFGVELRRDAKVKSGFKAWVVSADGEGGVAHARTHKIKVTLVPRRANGDDVLVAGDRQRSEGPGDLPARGGC
jgi:hypothetical protein